MTKILLAVHTKALDISIHIEKKQPKIIRPDLLAFRLDTLPPFDHNDDNRSGSVF